MYINLGSSILCDALLSGVSNCTPIGTDIDSTTLKHIMLVYRHFFHLKLYSHLNQDYPQI